MKHKIYHFIAITIFILLATNSNAAIPLMLPYSGTMQVDGEPYNGIGEFKFAIVNQECESGIGNCITYWSNDASSNGGSEPLLAIQLTVNDGKYSIKLGNIGLANMTSIPTVTFDTENTFLRVWFNDGVTGSQRLIPDRQLISVPYAHRAAVADSLSTGKGGSLPVGSIIDWWRPANSTLAIPEGFEICDGRQINNALSTLNGEITPDLTDQFVRGVDSLNRIGEVGGNDKHDHSTPLSHDHANAVNASSSAGLHSHNVDVPSLGSLPRTSTISGSHAHSIDVPNFAGFSAQAGDHRHDMFSYDLTSRVIRDGSNSVIVDFVNNSGIPDLDSSLSDKVANLGGCDPCFMPLGFPQRSAFTMFTNLTGTHAHNIGHNHGAFVSATTGDHSHATDLNHDHPTANSTVSGSHQHDVDLPAYSGIGVSDVKSNLPSYIGLLKLIKIY